MITLAGITWAAGLFLAYYLLVILVEIGKAPKNPKIRFRSLTPAEKIFIWLLSAIFIFLLIVTPKQNYEILVAIGIGVVFFIIQSLIITTPQQPKNDTDPEGDLQPINPNRPILPNLEKALVEDDQMLIPIARIEGREVNPQKKKRSRCPMRTPTKKAIAKLAMNVINGIQK